MISNDIFLAYSMILSAICNLCILMLWSVYNQNEIQVE